MGDTSGRKTYLPEISSSINAGVEYMRKDIFFNIWDNHFKMWGYSHNKNELTTYWGKIQNNPKNLQSKTQTFEDVDEMIKYIKTKTQQKLSKGYITIPKDIYSKYTSGEITLSQLVNEIETKKRAIDIIAELI